MGYKNPEEQRQFQREWAAKRRAEWLAANGPCKRCGSGQRLEVHHRDPSQKVSHAVWTWSAERRDAELAKCDVLCHECHRQETRKQQADQHPIRHGTRTGYRKGCRCDECRRVSVEYNRRLAERLKNGPTTTGNTTRSSAGNFAGHVAAEATSNA